MARQGRNGAWLVLLIGAAGQVLAGCEAEDALRQIPAQAGSPEAPLQGQWTYEPAASPHPEALLALGFVAGARYLPARDLVDGAGEASFVRSEGVSSVVRGGSTVWYLSWEGAESLVGRQVAFAVDGEPGVYLVDGSAAHQPLVVELFFSPVAAGDVVLRFAITEADGDPTDPVWGPTFAAAAAVTVVGTGALQVSLNWDTPTDVDLHLVEPSGEEIFYGAMTSLSGGELDLDSNAGCRLDHVNNENIFWRDDAPEGEYVVRVDLWDACGLARMRQRRTSYRVTVRAAAGGVQVFDGVFMPDEADHGDWGAGVEVLRFQHGGAAASGAEQ